MFLPSLAITNKLIQTNCQSHPRLAVPSNTYVLNVDSHDSTLIKPICLKWSTKMMSAN